MSTGAKFDGHALYDGSTGSSTKFNGLLVSGVDRLSSAPSLDVFRNVQVDCVGSVVVARLHRGDDSAQTLDDPLPAPGAQAVTNAVFGNRNVDEFRIDVYADQPGELTVFESHNGITYRESPPVLVTVPDRLSSVVLKPTRRFVRFGWRNLGSSTATVLELTVVQIGSFCEPGGAT